MSDRISAAEMGIEADSHGATAVLDRPPSITHVDQVLPVKSGEQRAADTLPLPRLSGAELRALAFCFYQLVLYTYKGARRG